MKLKIAVFSDTNPRKDYIDILTVPDNVNADDVITAININLKGCHCELIKIIVDNKRS